jgi:protein tyrosine/serine phosphatase
MDHDLPRTPSISVQWNRIFAACGNRAQPRPGASWRVALGAPVMSTLAPVVILEAAILPVEAQCSPAYMASPTAIKTVAPLPLHSILSNIAKNNRGTAERNRRIISREHGETRPGPPGQTSRRRERPCRAQSRPCKATRRHRDVVAMRNILLCATPAVLLSFAPASAQQAISTPILLSDENFRDLAGISAGNGGTGFVDTTSNNGVMRTGVFYRSEALSQLTNADSNTLSTKLHIGLDIDLRTISEIQGPANPPLSPNAGPDLVPNGSNYTWVNIYGTISPPSTSTSTPPVTDKASAVTYMKTTYQNFVTDPVQRAAFHTVLIDLANEADPALYHCSGGKDRTGWTSMLLQSIAGVSPTIIMQDYMASNKYMAASINQILKDYPAEAPIYKVMLGVRRGFLQAGLDQVIASYGSLNAYLIQGLGLTQADIYVLRAKMVYYSTLPGQSGLAGNAASGAAFLNALQNSPLSGHYTSYNYYLQSRPIRAAGILT